MALGFLATKARSDVLTLSVPADLVPVLVDAVDHLRASADSAAPLDALARDLAARARITAKRELVRELLTVAVDAAGDAVAVASTGLLRGEGSLAELRARLTELTELLDLLERLDA